MPAAELLGAALALLGWISAFVSCVLPMWKVTAFTDKSIITTETTWEGIWMSCVFRSTGHIACEIYDSMLDLSGDVQAARALTVTAILLGIVGLCAAIVGAKFTTCLDEEAAKARMMTVAGVALIVASLAQVIPVSWFAHNIIQDFYSSEGVREQKRELGEALYLGWAAAAFLLTAGSILLTSSSQKPRQKYRPPSKIYTQPQPVKPSDYDRGNYV